ncbi:hypothetical protein BC835DRAFT_1303361 [Cytidiella melzeri]|nr:hypothetical protein BC835DRAFT_1303361 [Cytidiella melzeri]
MRSNIVVALALLATVGPALSGPIASPATVSSDACTVAASRNDIVDSGATQLGRPLPAFSTFDSQTFHGEFAEILPRNRKWFKSKLTRRPNLGALEEAQADRIRADNDHQKYLSDIGAERKTLMREIIYVDDELEALRAKLPSKGNNGNQKKIDELEALREQHMETLLQLRSGVTLEEETYRGKIVECDERIKYLSTAAH